MGKEDLGVRVISRQLHIGERDHGNARVAHFQADQLRQFALDLIRNLAVSGISHVELRESTRHLGRLEDFQLVALFDVVEVLDR